MQEKRFHMMCRSQEANRCQRNGFEDADNVSEKVTRLSQTGILIFWNQAPVMCLSKKQNSVKTSTFGSEFTALKLAVELVIALWYKLRMFGLPLEGPTDILFNKKAVFKNISTPESVVRKKHHSITYHICRDAVADLICCIAKEDTKTNLEYLFTKILGRTKRGWLLNIFTYW